MLVWRWQFVASGLLAALNVCVSAASEPLRVYGVLREDPQAEKSMYEAFAEEFRLETGMSIEWLETDMSLDTAIRFEQARVQLRNGNIDVAAIDGVYLGGLDSSTIAEMEEVGFSDDEVRQVFHPGLLDGYTNTTGKLVAIPLFFNFGMLYYRSDLLRKYNFPEPSREGWTWDEMEHIARTVQQGEQSEGQTQFDGFVWTGKAYEGFTCVLLEVLAGSGGVNILGSNGTVMVDTPEYLQTLERMASWFHPATGISPLAALSYREENVVQRFCENGNAMFARNWPYMLTQCGLEGRQGLFNVTRMPGVKRGHGRGATGGNGLVVGKWANKTAAKAFISLLTSAKWQLRQYSASSRLSPRRDVSSDATICKDRHLETCLVGINRLPDIASQLASVLAEGSPMPSIVVNASSGLCPKGFQATVCNVDATDYMVARPATAAGAAYFEVSKAVYTHGNSVLTTAATATVESTESVGEGAVNRTIQTEVEHTNCAVLRALGHSPLPDQCYTVSSTWACIDGQYVDKMTDSCQPCPEGNYLAAIRLRSATHVNSTFSILETWDQHSLEDGEVVTVAGRYSTTLGGKILRVGVLSPLTLFLTDVSTGQRVLFTSSEEQGIQFRPVFSCMPCLPGHFTGKTSARTCDRCQTGRYQHLMGASACTMCPAGTFQGSLGQTECVECEVAGLESLAVSSVDGSVRCSVNVTYFGKSSVCIGLAFLAIMLLARTCISDVRILDVSWQDGTVVATTIGPHHIRPKRHHAAEVIIANTGCPDLDHRWKRLHAMRIGSDRLILSPVAPDEGWRHAAVDTSTGTISLPYRSRFVNTGVALPSLVWVCLVVGLEVAAVLFYALRGNTVFWANLLGAGAALLFSGVRRWYYWRSYTPLQAKICRYRDHLRSLNPKPTSCERGPGRAVKAGQLDEFFVNFSEFIRKRNMYYLHNNILLPLTAPYKLSFAEVAGPKHADYFISHYWGFPFANFVEAVRRHSQTVSPDDWTERAYWICSLSNNQWRLTEEVSSGDWRESSFYLTLNSGKCRATCMILDEQADPLKRSWCLFEVLQTFILQSKEGSNSSTLPFKNEDATFDGLVLCTTSGVLNTGAVGYDVAIAIAKRLSTLSVEEATASFAEDKKMIDELVMSYGGFAGMNEYVRSNIRTVLGTVRSHFESDYSTLDQALGDSPRVDEELVGAILEKHEELEKAPVGSRPSLAVVVQRAEEEETIAPETSLDQPQHMILQL